ncbi:hypothetical protein [Streptomyces sp. B21-101]|uniref:hypothetical protein n=1 Tax=Streptomyces sp. B21-101 TaxID=3039415 RepID=UPI002FF1714B
MAAQDVPLFQALEWIGEAPESRDGYSRDLFKHWNKGLNPTDGCDTRKEVILSEAKLAPETGARCALSGGRWFSEYDQVWVTAVMLDCGLPGERFTADGSGTDSTGNASFLPLAPKIPDTPRS